MALLGRFEILRELGKGGMGIVYEARDPQRNMTVALKTLRRLEATNLYRLKREFRAISDLAHPNIIALYELVAVDDEWFFTMEVVTGPDIVDYVRPTSAGANPSSTAKRAPDRPPPLPDTAPGANPGASLPHVAHIADLARVRHVFGQLAGALVALHDAGLVHRDLKPSNVRVTESGRVVLMDFGIVAETSENRGRSESAVGTPAYMAPEQIAGDPPTAAADWYAFGVMLYLALTNQLPFSGSHAEILRNKLNRRPVPVDMLVQGVPADLQRLCVRLLSRRPEHRVPPADILEAFGESSQATVLSSATTRGPLFVGRTRELEILQNAHAEAIAGKGQQVSVFIRGEIGMGKSALVRRFLDQIAPERPSGSASPGSNGSVGPGPLVLRGRCHERESLPYNAFDGLIDSLSHALLSLPAATVADLVPPDIALLARLFPVLGRVPAIAKAIPEDTSPSAEDPIALRDRAAAVLYQLLARMARLQLVVVYLEDLQWADKDSCDLLMAMRGQPAPILLIGTLCSSSAKAEPDAEPNANAKPKAEIDQVIDTMAARRHCHRIDLGPLTGSEQRELVTKLMRRRRRDTNSPLLAAAGATDSTSGPPGFLAEAGGNPMLLVELVRYLEDQGGAVDTRALGLEQVLSERIDRLPGDSRALLEAVAVAGEPLPVQIAGRAAGLDGESSERMSTTLRTSRLVRIVHPGPEKQLEIQHGRVRDIILGRLSAERKHQLHAGLARALETWEQATVDQLARHWRAADAGPKARAYLIAAAEAAEAKLAFDRAAELYQAALALPAGDLTTLDITLQTISSSMLTEAALLGHLAGALELAGRSYEAAQIYERAATDATGEEALELRRLAADSWLRSGRVQRGLERLAEVLRGLGVSYPRTRLGATLSLLARRALLALRGRRYRARDAASVPARDLARLDILYAAAATLGVIDHLRGAALQTRHLLSALALGEENRVFRALALESNYLAFSNSRGLRKGQALGETTLAQARRLGEPYLIGIVQLIRGGMQFFGSQPALGRATLTECEELLGKTRRAVAWERATARYARALACVATGDLPAVGDMVERYVSDAERRSDVYARSMFLCIPGTWWQLACDRPEDADRILATALDGWPEDTFYVTHYVAAFARAMVRLYTGDGAAALRLMTEILPATKRLWLTKLGWVHAEIHTLIGRAALQLGNTAQVRKAIRTIRRAKLPYADGWARLLEAGMHARAGARPAAERALEAAMACFEAVSASHMVAVCQMRLGALAGGERGAELVARGEAALRERGVVRPERMLELLAPGFPPASEPPSSQA